MDLKEYIRDSSIINQTKLAEKMFPTNKSAQPYLFKKLTGARPWTEKDTERAIKAIKELYNTSIDLSGLTADRINKL